MNGLTIKSASNVKTLYWVRFRAHFSAGGFIEHVRTVRSDHKIEYASDIDDLQACLAKGLKVPTALIMEWRELLGDQRPT